MDLRERRSLLSSKPNPDQRLDYVCSLGAPIQASIATSTLQFRVRYVPDRVILTPESLDTYLDKVGNIQWTSLEDLAVAILNDINDELIARWIEVSLTVEKDNQFHDVVLEERQPEWEDRGILSRLPTSRPDS
ncbi:MAG: hypothetical protein HQ501_12135 [Rhodospirillales bacterium]|nr:hypothetical protein [Rhodospirillales bacterium]